MLLKKSGLYRKSRLDCHLCCISQQTDQLTVLFVFLKMVSKFLYVIFYIAVGQQYCMNPEHYIYNPEQQVGQLSYQQQLSQEQLRLQQQQLGQDQMLQIASQQESHTSAVNSRTRITLHVIYVDFPRSL